MRLAAPAVHGRGASRAAPGALVALLLAALVAVPLPGTAQSGGTITVDASGGGTARVDLRADADKAIQFVLDEAAVDAAQGSSSVKVRLTRSGSSDPPLEYAMQEDPSGTWTVLVPVSTADLVAGSWTASFYALPNSGSVPVEQRAMTVTLADSDPPRILVRPAGDPVRLGPHSALEVEVQEEFLRSVTVDHAGLPDEQPVLAPYRVVVEALPEGVHNVTVTAKDRAGQTSVVVVRVDRDTRAPLLSVSIPEVGYVGVPFAIVANTTERSGHTVRLLHNGSAETRTVAGTASEADNSFVFVSTVAQEGNVTYTVEAVDLVGNRVDSIFTILVVTPPTDVRVIGLAAAPGPPVFVGSPMPVVALLEQVGGVSSLPVNVTFSTAGKLQTMTVTLPAAGPMAVQWNVTLPPGPRQVSVQVEGPAFANETNPGNENASATLETFLGSVRVGDDLYLIRADERGLPQSAQEQGTSRSYPLTLNQSSSDGVVYEFQLAGNRTATWDPLDPIAPEREDDPSSTSTGDSKGAAAPGLAMSLLVVALAVMVQRRKA